MTGGAKTEQYIVTFGGWYQRTTLHLSEIYAFFSQGTSKLGLSPLKLSQFHKLLDLHEVSRESGYLEYVHATSGAGIEIRYYEDGLYILQLQTEDIHQGQQILEQYYERLLAPGISYLFSLGAPTPKILANIKTTHPVVVQASTKDHQHFEVDEKIYGPVYSALTSSDVSVYKTPSHIFVVSGEKKVDGVETLVDMQIFFREFKDQLEKYLNIHRTIWEEIAQIKERKAISGGEVEGIRAKLDSYQKTISLISNRINQMGSYVHTRASVSKDLHVEEQLTTLFQYKFEVLLDTLEYIKEIWRMTTDYVSQAIAVMNEIQNQTLNASINSLRTVTTVGVITGIIGYLGIQKFPQVSSFGTMYFILLLLITWLVNVIVQTVYRARRYKLSFSENTTKL